MKILLHNLKEYFISCDPQYKIQCKACKKIQKLAKDWDYQTCEECQEYLYDKR